MRRSKWVKLATTGIMSACLATTAFGADEIEEVIAQHPKVLEVAAIGIPSEKSGEVVKVFIVRKDKSLKEKEIITFCKQHCTGYKVPKEIEFRDELPKSNVGKILRRKLRNNN